MLYDKHTQEMQYLMLFKKKKSKLRNRILLKYPCPGLNLQAKAQAIRSYSQKKINCLWLRVTETHKLQIGVPLVQVFLSGHHPFFLLCPIPANISPYLC